MEPRVTDVPRSWRLAGFVACAVLTGCGARGTAALPQTPSPARPLSSATATATPDSSCRLLTRDEVRSALGASVNAPRTIGSGDCLFSITGGTGEVNIGWTPFGSAQQARADLQSQASSDTGCCKVMQLSDLGQSAMSVTGKTVGTSVLAVFGSKVLTVNVGWSGAAGHPAMAITLAREAASHL
jgi:hypothetical protein